MIERKRLMHITKTVGALALIVLVAGVADAEGGKKKKKKKKQQSDATIVESQLLNKIDSRLMAYDTAGARSLLEPVTDSQEVDVIFARGRVLEQESKYDEAAAELQRVADLAPADPAPLIYLGETHQRVDRTEAARKSFAAAEQRADARLAEDPDDARSLYFKGVAQRRLQRYDEALATLRRARELAPKDEMMPYQIGVTHLLKSDYQPAFDELSKALEMNSTMAYAYYYRGLAADKVGRKDLLLNDLDRFVALAPNAPEAAKAQQILRIIRG